MYQALRGMKDILPGSSELWQELEKNAVCILRQFGYHEIRTPVLEEKGLFVKSVGGETDIVTKEMFSFQDRGERDVVLRPEGTAPIVRAYLEANLHKTDLFQKFYYIVLQFITAVVAAYGNFYHKIFATLSISFFMITRHVL